MPQGHIITMALRDAYLSMHRNTISSIASTGITVEQFILLMFLNHSDGVTQQQLVDFASSDPNTVRAMLVLLEEKGLITREKHPDDGRARLVNITEAGKAKSMELIKCITPILTKLVSIFNEKELNNLIDYLKRIADAMNNSGSSSWLEQYGDMPDHGDMHGHGNPHSHK